MNFVLCLSRLICHYLMCALMAFLTLSMSPAAFAETFLPPDEAFVFNAKMLSTNVAQVSFDIAPNYYMYRDAFVVEVVSPDGAVSQSGLIKLPAGQTKYDENFNKNVEIYHQNVHFNVALNGVGLYKLVVTSRGCADGGLCYPPRKTQAVLTAVADEASSKPTSLSKPSKPESTIDKIKEGLNYIPLDPSKDRENMAILNKNMPAKTTSVNAAINVVEENEPSRLLVINEVALTSDMSAPENQNMDNTAYVRHLFEGRSYLVSFGLVFGLGVLLSLTPCMLPMLPILSSMLAGQKTVSRRRGFALALAYVTGIAVVYAVVGVIAAQTGAGLHRYLQSPWLLAIFSGVLVVLALSLFDVFQIQLPARWQSALLTYTQGKNGYWGVALMGAGSALIASPCVTAPLVGLITYIAQTGNALVGGLALLTLAYGMGLPLLLLGAGLGQFLPKSGAWMVRVKQLIGAVMLLAALWVAQPLWGKYWDRAWGGQTTEQAFTPIKNLAALQRAVESSEKPVLLDLYADWCRSCIEMEQKTFTDPAVKVQLAQMTRLRVDMTSFGEDDAALLKHFSLYGPPALIVLAPLTGREEARVIGFEAAAPFAVHLKAALASAGRREP